MQRRLSGHSPLDLLLGNGGRRVQQVGACSNCGPTPSAAYARNGVSAFANNSMGGSRQDRIRYLQSAALAGQIPQIFLGVRATVDPTPAATAYVCAPSASVPLLVTRFEFEDDIAVFLDVNNFTIARLNMIAGTSAIAGTTFTSKSTAPPIEDPVLPAGVPMTIGGTNNDTNAHIIRGTLRGIDLTGWMDWINTGLGM